MHRKIWAAGLLLAATPALAQDPMILDYGNAMVNIGLTNVMNEAIRQEHGIASPNGDRSNFNPDQMNLAIDMAPGKAAPAIDARYRPDPAVRRKLADIMGDAAARQGADEAALMRKIVLSGDGVAQYQKVAPMLGYRANDAIDGLAFYMLAQWGVANDHRPAITRAQAAGVRRQAANAFAGVASQVNSDALRQEFGEMLMIQGAIMAGTHEAAMRADDREALARYAAMAREGGQTIFRADPVDIVLTDDGFRHK